jgi:uncharacterized protein YnzC (UPF0291/DUF896 family)
MWTESGFGGFPMLDQKKMNRINELARKSKTCELCEDEKLEQRRLREEYLIKFREVFRARLKTIEIVDGSVSGTHGTVATLSEKTAASKGKRN